MNGTGINLNFRGAFTSTMLGGGIALWIAGAMVSKDLPKVGDNAIRGGLILVVISILWYFFGKIIIIIDEHFKE